MAPAGKVVLLATVLSEACVFGFRKARPAPAEKQARLAPNEEEKQASFVGPATATVAVGEPGQVDFMLNLGAPGPASPGLQNQRGSNPCFQGLRVFHAEDGRMGWWVDAAARAGNLAFYWHAWVPSLEIDVHDYSTVTGPCGYENTGHPSTAHSHLWSFLLHPGEKYIESMGRVMTDPWYTNVTIFASRSSYLHDPDHVYQVVKQYGWGLVGSAYHSGGTVYGGEQISHLIQHPSTMECVLTFQGTASVQGWLENFDFPAEHFCGLVDADETCDGWSTCRTRHPRGSFVHGGFKHRLLSMVTDDQFQNNIRPHLGSCSRMNVVGHSLGGAVAELFQACASKAPQPGQYGYDDYKHMSWVKQQPAVLKYIQ